jgi:hypothetical protein
VIAKLPLSSTKCELAQTLVVIHLRAIAEERVGFVEKQEDAACPERVELRR